MDADFRRSGSLCASEYYSFTSEYCSVYSVDIFQNFSDVYYASKSAANFRIAMVDIPIRESAVVSCRSFADGCAAKLQPSNALTWNFSNA